MADDQTPQNDGEQQDQPEPTPPPQNEQDESALPDWAQKALAKARSDAGKARVTAKQIAAAEAAEKAKQEMAQQIGKALGLINDDDKADPEKLTVELAARDKQLRQLQVEQAAYKAAAKHNADPDALLDSRGVTDQLSKLDPSADDFASQVDAVIKAAVESNPRLKSGQAPGKSGNELPGGSGENNKPRAKTLAEAVENHYGT